MNKVLLGGMLLFSLNAAATAEIRVEVAPDRPEAIYHCGEQAVFNINVSDGGKPAVGGEVAVSCRFESEKPSDTVNYPLTGEPISVKVNSAKPGFMSCTATYKTADGAVSKFAVIGFDPESIASPQTQPEDYWEFWNRAKQAALEIPLDARLEKLDRLSDELADVYKISFANVGNSRMYGYISIPKGEGPYPACLNIPGAGPGFCDVPAEYPRGKAIAMTLNVHDFEIEPETCNARYDELNKDGIYTLKGIDSRDAFYYYRTILGLCRGVEYLTGRPDWDGRHLVVWGSSQGGAMTLATTALNSDKVTAAAVNVPAMCDFAAYKDNRQPGWPVDRAKAETYADTLQYYDGVNFARNVKCPMIFGVGLIDMTCPAGTVFAAYNSVKAPKSIWITPWMGHDLDPEYTKFRIGWIAEQLGVQP